MSWENAAEFALDWAAKIRAAASHLGPAERELADIKAKAIEDFAKVLARNDDVTPRAEVLK